MEQRLELQLNNMTIMILKNKIVTIKNLIEMRQIT